MAAEGAETTAEVVSRQSRSGTPGGSRSQNELLFVECFRFLKVFARQNREVQRRLYDRMNGLVNIPVAVSHMAGVLTEIFTGGPEICLLVKEDQVERLFQLVSSSVAGQQELLEALQAMAKVRREGVRERRKRGEEGEGKEEEVREGEGEEEEEEEGKEGEEEGKEVEEEDEEC